MAIGQFEAQIRWLSGFADFVTLDDLINDTPRRLGRWRIALTFDDGYRDNITLGLPVFEKYEAPVTWFVCTKFVEDQTYRPWWNLVDYAIDHVHRAVHIRFVDKIWTFDLADRIGQRRFARHMYRLFWMEDSNQSAYLRAQLETIAGERNAGGSNGFASAEEVTDAARSPWITIGGHTLTHPNLARCDRDTLDREVAGGRRKLQAWTGQDVNWFAYPYGRPSHWNEAAKHAVERAGFKGAVTGYRTYVSEQDHRYEMPRIPIPPAFSLSRLKATVLAANSSRHVINLRRKWVRR